VNNNKKSQYPRGEYKKNGKMLSADSVTKHASNKPSVILLVSGHVIFFPEPAGSFSNIPMKKNRFVLQSVMSL
jgi:hypothetical protein